MTDTTDLDPRFNAFRPDLADLSLKPFVTSVRFVEPTLHQCVRGVLPLYESPSEQALRLSEVRYGEFLDVFETREDGFAWVQSRNDRIVGYIRHEGALNQSIAALMNRVCALRTFVYSEPDFSSPVRDCLTLGSYISLDGEAGDFYPLASGGYIFKRHAAPSDEVFYRDLVFTAGQLMNVPYLVGGRTPLGLDAAGMVQLALDIAGIDAPSAIDQQQAQLGAPLPCHWRDMVWRRGDIVFFSGPRAHVGLMTGTDHLISASPFHMKVTTEPLMEVIRQGYRIVAAGHPA
ncbi:MAG: NlpC/P60 family protein [Alphaproteobacteria bacterium]|nr:NlpC/P60 family protein [Alphaproteobacteria bacterium]